MGKATTNVNMAISKCITRFTLNVRHASSVFPLPIAIAIKRFDVTTIMVFIMLEKDMIQAMTENNP